MIISAATDYFIARAIADTPLERSTKRKMLLAITLLVNLGLLLYFKYLMFFTTNFNQVMNVLGSNIRMPVWNIILPFGISFYTFETISYTLDVYRGHIRPEKSFLIYSLFVSFFPKLVAGPIQRASDLISQLKSRPLFSLEFIVIGFERILYGLFLKVVIADNIAPLVDEAFSISSNQLSGLDVITMAFLFGFQIYFDFSAYSHIAVGSAKVLGIQIPENFNFPYIALSLRDFWKRWHISLSSWIRDYLYLPLCGIKVLQSKGTGGIGQSIGDQNILPGRRNFALFTTWAIMGFWHGANWTFIIWGIYHAFFIFIERELKPLKFRSKLLNNSIVCWLITLMVSMLSWIPFRTATVHDTFIKFRALFKFTSFFSRGMRENIYLITGILLLLCTTSWFLDQFAKEKLERTNFGYSTTLFLRYAIMIILTFVFLRPINQFIYFQF